MPTAMTKASTPPNEAKTRAEDILSTSGPRLGDERPSDTNQDLKTRHKRWTFGIMGDPATDEVPGSILLMPKVYGHNEPLGLRNTPARRSSSSIPVSNAASRAMFGREDVASEKKLTANGKIILEPQPEDTKNDPLNWSTIRRDAALFSLGFYCMIGGGMTPILAAGFTNVSETYNVSSELVARTTGFYMLGLGVGSVIASPTAIAFGKRPVYLVASIIFALSAVWCAMSPNYASLCIARVFQGLAVSPVECLPSATIAEIYFLHERAYRLGIYTLLLLGGKNLIPLVSAAVIQTLGWRWVFWIVAVIVGFCFLLLFFLVPETFWDRTPVPKHPRRRPSLSGIKRLSSHGRGRSPGSPLKNQEKLEGWKSNEDRGRSNMENNGPASGAISERRRAKSVRIAEDDENEKRTGEGMPRIDAAMAFEPPRNSQDLAEPSQAYEPNDSRQADLSGTAPDTYFGMDPEAARHSSMDDALSIHSVSSPLHYTKYYRNAPPKTYLQTLKPYSGRLNHDNWFRVASRPFVLLAYPAILWSSAVYALSVGWLIILSEAVSTVYRSKDTYNFSALQVGLIYISPFIGGILGTVIAGKFSDIIVRYMSKKNDGIYEPEFRLVMAIPVAICTCIGLMGFGWSAAEHDAWIVPTVFFGFISFGATLGSTTAITFAVDSYRQYSGEALVSLNFCKNIPDGLAFSLFFSTWLTGEGSKDVFLVLGGIELFFLLWTIPLYIYGKRLRMWTVRRNFMEKY